MTGTSGNRVQWQKLSRYGRLDTPEVFDRRATVHEP
jgi:hypothetical protein